MGGAWFQEAFGDPDQVSKDHLLTRATKAVGHHLGIIQAPIWSHVAVQRVKAALDSYPRLSHTDKVLTVFKKHLWSHMVSLFDTFRVTKVI